MDQGVLPFSQVVEQQRRKWMPFKRALRKQDQEAFERMFACVKGQARAEVYFPRSASLEAVMLAVLLEHQRRIEEMVRRLADGRAGRGEGRPPVVRRGAARRIDRRQMGLFEGVKGPFVCLCEGLPTRQEPGTPAVRSL